MFIVAMIVATVGAIVTIVLYGSVLNGMGAETLRGFLKVRTKIFGQLSQGFTKETFPDWLNLLTLYPTNPRQSGKHNQQIFTKPGKASLVKQDPPERS